MMILMFGLLLVYENKDSSYTSKMPPIIMKVILAYWPSQWQAATEDQPVIDLVFGIFSSKEKAIERISNNLEKKDWAEYNDQFVYAELDIDQYMPIPKLG